MTSQAARRYGPMVGMGLSLLLVIAVLPSALNLPQSNPTTTPEFAPVPPSKDKAPPLSGNFAGVGFATGTGIGNPNPPAGGGQGLPPLGPGLAQVGKTPSTKLCVGNPPRQTEDPLSPPCVAYFQGDNGGATYQGVSRSEIRVLVYSDSHFQESNCNTDMPPPGTYYDLWKPADSTENTCVTRDFRAWQSYFNFRFQTYNRRAHFFVYFSGYDGKSDTATARRADAVGVIARVHPFATMLGVDLFGNQNDYLDAMARHGVMYFTSQDFKSASFYRKYAPLLWGYAPSLEEKAKDYAAYFCNQIAPFPVSFSGNGDNGKRRVYGLVETTDPTHPELRQFQDLVADKVKACGIVPVTTAYYPVDGRVAYTGPQQSEYERYATPAMATFKAKGVTTILWPAGFEIQFSKAASTEQFYPEWLTGGAGVADSMDGYQGTQQQDQQEWAHAIVVTGLIHSTDASGVDPTCNQAFEETTQGSLAAEAGYACGWWYPSLLQLFTGIQVAGPKLTPKAMDQGFHAIPPHPSTGPTSPACFYDPADYTCVKDAMQMYWNTTMTNAGGTPGCWRVIHGGQRVVADGWPRQDASTLRTSNDPCDSYYGSVSFFLSKPA